MLGMVKTLVSTDLRNNTLSCSGVSKDSNTNFACQENRAAALLSEAQ